MNPIKDALNKEIELVWQNKSQTINWLALETLQRKILSAYNANLIIDTDCIKMLDSVLGAYTGRGRELQ